MAQPPMPRGRAGHRLMRNVGLSLFFLLILVYWGLGYNLGNALAWIQYTDAQRTAALIEYLWELPAIGVPFGVVIPLLMLRPVARDYDRMLAGQPLEDPEASLRRVLRYPQRIVWYFTPLSILAYLLGNLQSVWFTGLPAEEFVKAVPFGLPLGLLTSVASYIALVRFLDPVRRLFVQRHGYRLARPRIVSIQRKVMVLSVTILGLGLVFVWLIAIGQGQVMLEDQLYARMEEGEQHHAVADALDLGNASNAQAIAAMRLGAHGYAFVTDGQGRVLTPHPRNATTLADEGLDPAAQQAALTLDHARLADRVGQVRLVVEQRVPGTDLRVFLVTYRTDFAGPVDRMALAMVAVTALALGIALALTWAGTRALARPMQELTEAMRQARDDGTGGGTTVLTDDEIGALAASYDHMMARLRDKTRALEDSVERLKEMDELKTRFINIASHELRTPMTPIRTELHLLRNRKRGPLTRDQEQALLMVARNVDRLNRLIRELLEASRMQAGRLHLQVGPCDLQQVARDAARTMDGEARAKGVELAVAGEAAQIQADADRVAQVMINLIENAIQFTPRGGRVLVEVARGGGEAVVRVRDTGAGIETALIPKLFEPFSQAEPGVPRTEGGTGLGLFICRGLVEGHGGRIWCESEGRGKGATFAFTLPAPSAQEDVAPGAAQPPGAVGHDGERLPAPT